jgi:hypothetical protein
VPVNFAARFYTAMALQLSRCLVVPQTCAP